MEKLIVRGSLFTAADPERDREGERGRAPFTTERESERESVEGQKETDKSKAAV